MSQRRIERSFNRFSAVAPDILGLRPATICERNLADMRVSNYSDLRGWAAKTAYLAIIGADHGKPASQSDNAACKSSNKSSACSMPMDKRSKLSVMPAFCRASAVIAEWVMEAG